MNQFPIIRAEDKTQLDVAFCGNEANAQLIAAAPLLAEALQAIAAIQNKLDGGDWDEIEQAREIACQALAAAGVLS